VTRGNAGEPLARFRYRWRFDPQVLALLLGVALAGFPLAGMIEAGIHVVWSDTFAAADYTMDEARTNEGSPYISGTIAPSGETVLIPARLDASGTFRVGNAGAETFARRKVIRLWWSPSAPDLLIQGMRTNAIPLASMARRPGGLELATYSLWFAAVVVVAARVFAWSARKAPSGHGEGRVET